MARTGLKRGRPMRAKIAKKARTKAFGHASRGGAKTPNQIKASVMRGIKRPRMKGRR